MDMHGLFVDDMAHASTSEKLKPQFIKEYKKEFYITCEDIMTSFLGMEVEQDEKSIKLHLDTYVQDMLDEYKPTIKKFNKPKQMPMQPGVILEHDDCPETPDPREQKIYRTFSAKLQFVAAWIRCDVSYTASQLPRFCASAGPTHWAALHHLMGYLEANPTFKLNYRKHGESGLEGFADSDWENSVSRRSTTGLMARYYKGMVQWRYKLQKTILLSTAEAEYYAASEMAIEVIYLRNLLENIIVVTTATQIA